MNKNKGSAIDVEDLSKSDLSENLVEHKTSINQDDIDALNSSKPSKQGNNLAITIEDTDKDFGATRDKNLSQWVNKSNR